MKATATFTTLALAASVFADDWTLPQKRDVATIQTVITNAQNALTQLDTTVKAFNGQSFTQLATDASNLKNVLTQGTTQIQGTSAISANDAVSLQGSLGPVQTAAQSLSTDLSAKKSAVEQASLCDVVFQQTKDIGTAAKGLIDATVQKTPAEIQQIAGQLTGQFTAQLDAVSGNFATGNCTNASGGSGAGISPTNGTSTTNSGSSSSSSTLGKSAANVNTAGAFGFVVAAVAGLLML
ncbi:cell wall protein [Diaporthe amygdali]|uniref:cell wall protein n=1 Tax=Phomopsis amygdali TaxID=1214568 RepID=UPI0022FECEC5|nr:cell wall protein [Diaporthe amygdali]KAJ0119196.1 cell wall protein [Diaporthe amygdali]